ncbi:hypothetical protein [Nonomuraea sp. NPDC050783]|uniref:hypothetical protein n=1 Tax=Nonomuraea sp. NPDC050783 TaxID=3154634 RepID=UPI003467C9C1
MFGLGAVESVFLALLLVVVGIGIGLGRRAGRRGTARISVNLGLMTPVGIQARAHDLIEAGRFAEAVKLIRKESQVSRRTATEVAQALRAGDVLPDLPMLQEGDLSSRVRALIADGRRKEAVFLARSHENMSPSEAEAFVDSLSQGPTA